ncbi:hypothetical protein OV079_41745 [Nannocystis pusilla]|uniref:Uncharacterized protein n=1 Tax=Nannocystis pusilla TaxID=889268 RepID=A0A9X3F5N1_9BACT|nr:hypothetical protein [Nannocystis pusilla]MCY1011961.1 hypothetical protein [Nannocystis pusilla]
MLERSLFIFVIAACGPQPPDDGATVGDTSSGATTTTGPAPATTTGPAPTTTTSSTSGATDDSGSAASVDPTIGKLDLTPPPDEPPPPSPPACDPPPEVPADAHCEVLEHRSWQFIYACLEGADPDACPDAAAATVLDLLNDCSRCAGLGGEAMCGPDPRRQDACCYWGFDVSWACPFP